MTTELTKAAQQALEALKNVTDYDQINAARRALQAALAQRPAAQTEREAFEAWYCENVNRAVLPDYLPKLETYSSATVANLFSSWKAGAAWLRASQPAPQQATPEPLIVKGAMAGMVDAQVRDLWPTKGATPEPVVVVHQIRGDTFDCPHAWRDATEEAFYATPAADRRILYTRPAPGVPEGFALVPVEPTPEMKAEGIKVEVYSEASDSIGALTWAEVAAIYRAMLAAAQAKGAGHE